MLLTVTHSTRIEYSEPIAETVMELRMTPRTDRHQTLRGIRVDVGPSAPLLESRDWLGNHVHQFSILPPHERVVIVAQSVVDTHREAVDLTRVTDALGFESELGALHFTRFGRLVPHDPRLDELAQQLGLDGCSNCGELIDRVSRHLLDHVSYKKGVTTSAATLSKALDQGAGVCQDLTHIAIGLLRLRSVPARYVSGYLHRESASAELETHAWCEAWTPSAGFVAFDPTHRQTAGDGHVAVAVGRDYADVPPNRGVYRGEGEERIQAEVSILPCAEPPDGLLMPRTVQVGISQAEVPRRHREALDYQQEQQQQ